MANCDERLYRRGYHALLIVTFNIVGLLLIQSYFMYLLIMNESDASIPGTLIGFIITFIFIGFIWRGSTTAQYVFGAFSLLGLLILIAYIYRLNRERFWDPDVMVVLHVPAILAAVNSWLLLLYRPLAAFVKLSREKNRDRSRS